MTAVPLPLVQNTDAWEAARQSPDFIGSSDIPIITGSSPYKGSSAYDLWAYKTGRLDRLPVDDETQELFDLGHALEPVIADRYTVMTGRPLRRVNRTLRHPDIPWAVASLDRVSAVKGERLIVEVKWDPWARYSHAVEGVPPHVLEQVQWEMFVRGREWRAEVAVLMGSHVSRFEVEPDAEFQDNLLFIADVFRQDCLAGTPPPIDGSEATRKAIARLHPTDNGEQMEPTAELRALMGELHEAIPVAEGAAEEVARLKNAIRSALGDYSGAETDRWRVTFRRSKPRRTTDWKAVAAAYRALLDLVVTGDELPTPLRDALPAAPLAHIDLIEGLHTTESDGARPLNTRWAKEEGQGWT